MNTETKVPRFSLTWWAVHIGTLISFIGLAWALELSLVQTFVFGVCITMFMKCFEYEHRINHHDEPPL